MQDRSAVQQRRNEGAGPGRHAVVVGGSIGGMLAARALADQFDKVTVIERDQLPEGDSENRPGVPHARHLHFFFKRGLMVVEELFPGVTADLLESGSHLLDQGRDFRILYRSGWSPRAEIGLEICTFTRPLLEATIRRHLMTNAKINLLQGFEVAGFVTSADGSRVEGVSIQPRHHDGRRSARGRDARGRAGDRHQRPGLQGARVAGGRRLRQAGGDGRRRLLGLRDADLRAGRGLQEGLEDACS